MNILCIILFFVNDLMMHVARSTLLSSHIVHTFLYISRITHSTYSFFGNTRGSALVI